MKSPIIPLIALAIASVSCAHAADLTVTVSDIRKHQGTIRVALFNSESAWKEQTRPLAGQMITASGDQVSLRFTGLPAGIYAVQVMHDENDNGRLDANLLGVPTEGFGFSGNSNAMRRAHFDEARFSVGSEDTTVIVQLR